MGDTGGHLGWALVLLLLGPVLYFVVRRRWRNAAARAEEVRRLAYLAAAEADRAEKEAFMEYSASIMRESGWVPQPPPVVYDEPSPAMPQPVVYVTVAPSPPVTEKRPVCAVCFRETTTRCARCKAVRYCSGKCQIIHWRQGHKDECREPQIQPDEKPDTQASASSSSSNSNSNTEGARVDKQFEEAPPAPPSQPSEEEKVITKIPPQPTETGNLSNNTEPEHDKVTAVPATQDPPHTATVTPLVREEKKLSSANNNKEKTTISGAVQSGTGTRSLKKVGDASRIATNKPLDNAGALANGAVTSVKNFVKQHSTSKIMRHYPSDLSLFPYDLFLKLYNSDKMELRPFGLINCGNSCYANTVLQCLTFTRPLTAYLLEGLHSKKCGSKSEWCFTCEFERLVLKGKQSKSSLSPVCILSGLSNTGSPFGVGREEDAHEFMKYVIEKMQSVCIKESGITANNRLAEETTLMQLIFGGYLRSKIRCMKCQGSSEQCERMMDLTVPIEGNIGTLHEALAQFTSAEILDGDNKYQCNKCKSYERAKKKMTILEAPNVLTIALKRFQSGKFGKINKPVRFPEHLNLFQYMSNTDDNTPVYSLYAVVVHRDVNNASFSGHYICCVKDPRGKWYEIDDSSVVPISIDAVLSKCAYLLLYARCSPRAPSSVRRAMAMDPVRKKPKQPKPANPNPTRQPAPFYPFEDGSHHHYPSEYSSDSSSLFSNSDEGCCSSSSMSTESMTSVDSTRNSTSNDNEQQLPFGDFLFGDSDRISSGLSAGPRGPNPQFEDSGLSCSFLYTDSSGGLAEHHNSSSSRRETETDRGLVGRAEGTGGSTLLRRPARERSAQTFYS